MNEIETLTMAVSIASLILAVVAIILSFKFYEMSSKTSNETKDATKEMKASVEELKAIFGLLYKDTFSMMRDTVQDIRRHALSAPDLDAKKVEAEVAKKLQEMKEEIVEDIKPEISRILKQTEKDDTKIREIEPVLEKYISKAIWDSRDLERSISEARNTDKLLLTIYIMENQWHRPISSTEIADFLLIQGESIKSPTIQFIIHHLVSDESLVKQSDKRKVYYALTDKGRTRVEKLLKDRKRDYDPPNAG